MAPSLNLYSILIVSLIYRTSAAPISPATKPDTTCSSAQLIAPGQDSLVYQYKTEVKLSVANSQYDLKTEITASVEIKSLGDCNYALQLRNVKVTETKDENENSVTSTANAQRDLENLVVRFRWIDGFLVVVEADSSAKIDHVNFVKGVLSTLQVYSPVATDSETVVREEDVLGVCTTVYKYSQRDGVTQVKKSKDLTTCSKDKLHLSSSPILTSLLGPLMEEVFTAKTRYICQTEIRDKKIQSVKCKTIEMNADDTRKSTQKNQDDDDSAEEDFNAKFDNNDDDDEISSKLISIKQELKLQPSVSVSVDENAVKNPVPQTLQFVPTASFDQSNEVVSTLVAKIQELLKTENWNEFAASQFVEITNELRRMDKANLQAFKDKSELKHLVPAFLNTVYSHGQDASLLNFNADTLTFTNPSSVYYLDNPSTELVDQVVQGASRLTTQQVVDFVGVAARILKTYKSRQDNIKDADNKIKQFKQATSRFLLNESGAKNDTKTAVLSAYAQLGLYDDQVLSLAIDDTAPLEVRYHALNAIRYISSVYLDDTELYNIRQTLRFSLLGQLENKTNKNAVRIWTFQALYSPFIYDSDIRYLFSGSLEDKLQEIVDEPLNQVNGFIWSALKYSSLNPLCPLRGLAARIRVNHNNRKQFLEQATLSSRQIRLEIPLGKNYQAFVDVSVIFENDRVVPSFLSIKLAFDGVRRETLRLPWVDVAIISENLDWNFADYFLRLDPLNKNLNDDEKSRLKTNLPSKLKQHQDTYDAKEEDPNPSVHLYLRLFGTDVRAKDITDKVQDILRSSLRKFIGSQILTRLNELVGKDPIFRIPLEIGAVSGTANGLALYKSAQVAALLDLTTELRNTQDDAGLGIYSMTSRSALSFSLTVQREVSSPLTTVGETVEIGILSYVPFEYKTEVNNQGRTREFNLLKPNSKLFAMDFQYATRTSHGFELVPNKKTPSIDPSCSPSAFYRTLGVRACLELNPFRSIQFGKRNSYPITVTVNRDPSIKNWRLGWRFNAQEAPQYEVIIEKVGTNQSYPGLGVSATKDGNKFDIKVLTGMKSFNVKGTQTGETFSGTVYSSDNNEVMTTSGTLAINNDGFKLESKLFDIASKKEVVTLTTDILPNRGQGLTANFGLTTPDKAKSFKVQFLGDLYKPNSKKVHINGDFNLGETSYNGKLSFERDNDHTRIELQRLFKLGQSSSAAGYEFFYERKTNQEATQSNYNIASHVSLRTPASDVSTKLFNLKTDFTRTIDLSNVTLQSSLDYLLVTRNPPVQETIEIDYTRRSARITNQGKRLTSPEANLKVQVKTKSNVFNFLLDHRHRKSSESSKKGPAMLPPTLDINNKIHVVVDTDKLFPDIPHQVAFDILSDLDFQLLNEVNYKFQYNLPRRQRSGLFTYHAQVDKVTHGQVFSGTSKAELQLDNKQIQVTGTGTFDVCLRSYTLKSHWDFDTNLVEEKNDMELYLNLRFDKHPKKDSPKSLITFYDVKLKAPKHKLFQLIDLDGNLTKQSGKFETWNSIAIRANKKLKEINLNAFMYRNLTGDNTLQTHIGFSLPFKYLPYVTHDLKIERIIKTGDFGFLESRLIAKPVFAHYARLDASPTERAHISIDNEIEYLRANGDSLYALSKIYMSGAPALHSFGLLKRNSDLLHKHSIGFISSSKTKKVAVSLVSPQISSNPLSIIGEFTMDRENHIGKMKLPQEFGIHFEFGTPISNLTAFRIFYNLPLFNKNHSSTADGSVGFKIASPKIAPISFYLHSKGSLNTSLHLVEALRIGNDIAAHSSLTAQYNPQSVSLVSTTTSTQFYGKKCQSSLYALFKQHQVLVRGLLNTADNENYTYEMDVGLDNDSLTGHTERTNGQETTISDIDTKKCTAAGKYHRCYKGDITVRTGTSSSENKGTFDISWGRDAAKLDIKVSNHVELSFDHAHIGRVRDADFSSKTNIEGKILQPNKRGAFTFSSSIEKEDDKWNDVKIQTTSNDMTTGQKSSVSDIRFNQKITDKRSGQFQRKFNVNVERQGLPAIIWSSDSFSCSNNPSYVIYGVCQTTTFNIKANNLLIQQVRQRLQLTVDPRLSNPLGQVTYDGTLNLDLKHDPTLGPHTVKFDLNRLREEAIDLDLSYQKRVDEKPMSLNLKVNIPQQNPISIKYDETIRSKTSFNGVLKYSFNANDSAAEKTYTCDVNQPYVDSYSMNCQGERTNLTIDIGPKTGITKFIVDLNRFTGERIGYETAFNFSTRELETTYYTLVTSWMMKYRFGKLSEIIAKQKDLEVLRITTSRADFDGFKIRFLPANIELKLAFDPKSNTFSLSETYPQQRDYVKITIEIERIRRYMPSLRNVNRPSYDIDDEPAKSQEPIFRIQLDSYILISVSQALGKIGSHNGLFGLETVKKSFRLQIGNAPLTVYNIQHWKTHLENIQLPESYSIRIVNDANGNSVQLATNKWNENRLISTISHSFDGGKTQTTDLKLDRNYAYQVGSIYFLHSLGYRNIQGVKQLRNSTRQFICEHLTKDLDKTNLAEFIQASGKRVRSIVEKDYAALIEIFTAWSKEPENSFLRKLTTRFGLLEFFTKYPTYAEASDRVAAILDERHVQRGEFWRSRVEDILNNNRLKDLSQQFQTRRSEIIQYLLSASEKALDRFLPKIDQNNIDERIVNFVRKLLASFEQVAKRNSEQWKAIFKAIDDASKGDDNKWFRVLVADIDSNAVAAAADAELTKVFKKLDDSSKLLVSNIQQISRRINQRRESIRERVQNAIRHLPKASVNDTNSEILYPIGRRPGSYSETSKLVLLMGTLLRYNNRGVFTMKCIIKDRFQTRGETFQHYSKAVRTFAKRLFKRNSSLTPEFSAVIANTGDTIDLHGDYVYLNPSCDYVLAHDFGGLKFSFRFIYGKVYSVLPNLAEIKENECSNTGRVQLCNRGYYSTLNVPMYYGGLVDGALGDVRDRSGKGHANLSRWLVRDCPAATRDQTKEIVPSIPECASDDTDEQEFCENFVQRGTKSGLSIRLLVTQAIAVRKDAL